MRKGKNYPPWDSQYHRQMRRGIDKMFQKKPNDPDQTHWILIFFIFIVVGFVMAALKN